MVIPLFEQQIYSPLYVVQIKELPSGESEKDSHLNEIVFKHPNRTSLDEETHQTPMEMPKFTALYQNGCVMNVHRQYGYNLMLQHHYIHQV